MRYALALPLLLSAVIAGPVSIIPRQNAACAPFELFTLAGTGERGLGLVGGAFERALPGLVAGATVTPIDYDTSAEL